MAAEQTHDRFSVELAHRAAVEEALLVELQEVRLELDRGEPELGLRAEDRDVGEVVEVEQLLELGDLALLDAVELEHLRGVDLDVQQRQDILDFAVVCIQVARQELFELFAWVINDYSLTGQSIA